MGEIVNGFTGGNSITVDVLKTYYDTPPVVDAVNIFD